MVSGIASAGNLLRAIQRSALCGIAVAALTVPCVAQRGQPQPTPPGGNASSPGPILSANPTVNPESPDPFGPWNTAIPGVIMVPADASRMVDSEGCNTWTESGVHTPTVSVTRLKVPDKAIGEFQKACSSYKDKNLSKAEEHARKAIGIYPDYPADWVLLGQVLDAQHNRPEADKACSQATTIDPQYIASYLCLADFAARDENWNQLSKLSDEALAIDPVGNAYALYYSADAEFHMKKLAGAETSARAAVQLDPWHKMPQLHLLLAHIYQAKGDPHSEIAELRDYLKQASNAPDALAVRAALKQLESPPQNPPSSGVQ
jgi:hypothetical protein